MNTENLHAEENLQKIRSGISFVIPIDHFLLKSLNNNYNQAALLTQIRYWSGNKSSITDGKSNQFYKFISPCDHPLYVIGDSWVEEIGCAARTLKYAIKNLKELGLINSRSEKLKGNLTYYWPNERQIELMMNQYLNDNLITYQNKIQKRFNIVNQSK